MTRAQPELPRVARILDLVITLSHQPLTRRQLAERYNVSERQITSDLTLVRDELQIEVERTEKGYQIRSLPSLPSVKFELAEVLSLFLAAAAGSRTPGIPQATLSSALRRIQVALPKNVRNLLQGSEIPLPPAPASRHREQILRELAEAITLSWTVEMEYRPPMRERAFLARLVDPYALVPYLRGWYLIGWCHTRKAWRTFKVDRIKRLRNTRTHFQRRDFDLGEFLMTSWGMIEARDRAIEEVELLFSPPAAHWVAEEQWHTTQQLEWLPDGRLRFRVRIPLTPDFARWVLSYGDAVEIVRPEALRARVMEHAAAILARHRAAPARVIEHGLSAGVELDPA